ncbi:hypothetical protein GH714_030105 [Hevea brasiliensis]|uniref:Peptidase S1 domain-containing protein n=1 Tax=Hevea brasiliensis TaxID=3981 RepID=A0A6A6MN48_HEVBR|nr:hypothetical protein GH714_030105 [Hevea brasiliensis]
MGGGTTTQTLDPATTNNVMTTFSPSLTSKSSIPQPLPPPATRTTITATVASAAAVVKHSPDKPKKSLPPVINGGVGPAPPVESVARVVPAMDAVVKMDAAINLGNSGGPASNDKGHRVGIGFQSLKGEDVENIGHAIPTPVIIHFIQDYENNGAYTIPYQHGESIGFSYLDSQKFTGDNAAIKVLVIRRL